AVDVERRGFLGNARVHGSDTAEVGVTRLGGNDVAHDHMPYLLGSHTGALQGSIYRRGSQRCQRRIPEGTSEGSYCCARCADPVNRFLRHWPPPATHIFVLRAAHDRAIAVSSDSILVHPACPVTAASAEFIAIIPRTGISGKIFPRLLQGSEILFTISKKAVWTVFNSAYPVRSE